MPINNPPMFLLKTSKKICPSDFINSSPQPFHVIIIVKSLLENVKKREMIRRSIKSQTHQMDVALVFSLGSGTRNVDSEAAKYDDIIQGDYDDDVGLRSTARLITNLRWASGFCNQIASFFLITDDTSAVNLTALYLQHVKQIAIDDIDNTIYGVIKRNEPVLPNSSFPWPRHPTLVDASFYAIGSRLLDGLAIASAFTMDLPNPDEEEIFLGLLMTKIIPPRSIRPLRRRPYYYLL